MTGAEVSTLVGRTPSKVSGGQRYRFVDALRGFAALGVVVVHADDGGHFSAFFQQLPSLFRWIIRHGNTGVEVFFVLSGFVIAHSLTRSGEVTLRYTGRFMLRRSIRLDPPYWASIALYAGFQLISTVFVPGKAYEPPSFAQLGLHMLYMQHFFGVPDIMPVYWTLCFEIQFYLVFAMLMLLATRLTRSWGRSKAFFAVMIPPVLFASLWPLDLAPWSSYRVVFPEKWHLFLLGALVAWALGPHAGRFARAIAWADVAFLAAVALIREDVALAVGALTGGSILAVGQLGRLTTALSARPLQWMGAISYSLYLVHIPVTGALFRVAYRLTGRSLATETFWFFGNVAVCLAAAHLFYRLIERPSLRLSQKISLVDRAPPQPVVAAARASVG